MSGENKETTKAATLEKALEKAHLSDYTVSMSNALATARHGLTLTEKRLIAAAVSRLDSRRPQGSAIVKTRITAAEYAETFNIDIDTAYSELKSAGNKLYERSITFYRAANRRKGKPLPPTRTKMRWIGARHYQDGEGWIELEWWPEVVPHLIGLYKQFTSYKLAQASALRSTYSWRLLELLMRYESTGWAEYDIDDFAEAMDATDKQRADFAAIRRRMIEPAVRELNEKDGWIIQWRAIKKGRRVAKVRFEFMRDPQQRIALEV